MKSTRPHIAAAWRPGFAVALALLMAGCAGWSATPVRAQRNYGASVHAMVVNQIANPDKAAHPAPRAPDGMEGNKADRVLEMPYRADIGSPQRARVSTTTSGSGYAGTSGSSGMSGTPGR